MNKSNSIINIPPAFYRITFIKKGEQKLSFFIKFFLIICCDVLEVLLQYQKAVGLHFEANTVR